MAESLNELLLILLVSSWLNIVLYTFELVLCCRYFARPSRPLVHKIGVGALVLADTVCIVAIGFNVCLAVLRLPVSSANLRLLLVPTTLEIMSTYISAVVAQLFLCNLYYVLTGNRIVAGAIFVLIFVHLGFSWASAVIAMKTMDYSGKVVFTTAIVGAVSCAATDLIIAVSLAWKFWTMMGRTFSETSTRSLLRRVLIMSVSSGAIDAGNTLVVMILLIKNTDFFQFFFTCQGRVYALTILGNFLVGIPALENGEPRTSQLFIATTSAVVFRNTTLERPVPPADRPKSMDRLHSPIMGPLSLSYTSHELDDLTFAPVYSKAESRREST
ncbi:hypothetical protein DFH06DRAFT_1169817 [Mycena polygramma]|nr:hypothetical protein DFH06DRAFT_1169817 [Mycena polygramma]